MQRGKNILSSMLYLSHKFKISLKMLKNFKINNNLRFYSCTIIKQLVIEYKFTF